MTYVVWNGNPSGLYDIWEEAEKAVRSVKGASCKRFDSYEEALHAFETMDGKWWSPERREQRKLHADMQIEKANLNYEDFDAVIYFDGSHQANPSRNGVGLAIYEYGSLTHLKYGWFEIGGTCVNHGIIKAFKTAVELAEVYLREGMRTMLVTDSPWAFENIAMTAQRPWSDYMNEYYGMTDEAWARWRNLSDTAELRKAPTKANITGRKLADILGKMAVEEQIIPLEGREGALEDDKVELKKIRKELREKMAKEKPTAKKETNRGIVVKDSHESEYTEPLRVQIPPG
ncbi:hypothetical protein GCM10022278_38220 [Allohahella marinimesophila]|uniref:Ribonuclease H1 N-terminal domain-containing protein n=1 Tax=Allohahella marinimesophila TaxID=1054972 RepID=A0ABP7Q8M4_9GAMM